MTNILHLSPNLEIACGRTKYVLRLLESIKASDINLFLGSNEITNHNIVIPKHVRFLNIQISPEKRNIINFFHSIFKLNDYVIKNNIHIIHTHHRYAEVIAYIVKRLFRNNIRLITSINSLSESVFPFEYKSDILIAVSNYVENFVKEHHKINPEKIITLYNYVEEYMYDKTTTYKKCENTLTLFAAGRFHKDKGFMVLLKAMRILTDQNINLLLIGEGCEESNYKEYIAKHKLNVKILSPKKDLSPYYSSSHICIIPSIVEPLPYFILDAGMFSKPIIGSNTGGIKEVIRDNINGLLFEANNETELSKKILFAQNNIEFCNLLGDKLNETVKEKFNERQHINKILYLYKCSNNQPGNIYINII
ncbi:MAG: glycosyltransferase family 4 protein [Ignavibacteriae bacterium]|nr:glycosyltransferase family 4 protein [Ignavibacteriota bacterium]